MIERQPPEVEARFSNEVLAAIMRFDMARQRMREEFDDFVEQLQHARHPDQGEGGE